MAEISKAVILSAKAINVQRNKHFSEKKFWRPQVKSSCRLH